MKYFSTNDLPLNDEMIKFWNDNGYLVIEDGDLPLVSNPETVSVPLGGALFMSNLTPHCSTENTSDVVRWSLDLRYQNAKVPNNVGAVSYTHLTLPTNREV